MRDRTKNLILKTLLVVGIILMFAVFPGGIFIAWLVPNEEIATVVFNTILFAMFSVGVLFMILLPILGGLKQKPVRADKLPLLFNSYDELFSFLERVLCQRGYHVQKSLPISSVGEVTVFFKPSKRWILECFTIVRVTDLSEQQIEVANESITNILTGYYHDEMITDAVNMISVFCVDRITPAFQKLVNSNIQQGLKNGRLPVGISFGGKKVYIARQTGGFAIAKYKRLRKELIDIMNLYKTD